MFVICYRRNPNKAHRADESPEDWVPYSTENKEYMVLKTGGPATEKGLRYRKCYFWSNVYPQLMKGINKSEYFNRHIMPQ